jgi:hypothetical protein
MSSDTFGNLSRENVPVISVYLTTIVASVPLIIIPPKIRIRSCNKFIIE